MGAWAAAHALGTQAAGPPGHASSCGTARPTHSARHARVARGETAYGNPAHHPLSPSRAALGHATGRASPNTAPGVFDTVPPAAHGMPGVVVHPGPTPGAGTSGSRATHGRGARRTP